MKFFKTAVSLADPAVAQLAKRINRKRRQLASNVIHQITETVDQNSALARIGLERLSVKIGADLTLAAMAKAWVETDNFYRNMRSFSGPTQEPNDPIDAMDARIKDAMTRISSVEWEVFGRNLGSNYPRFESFAEWAPERLNVAHPGIGCNRPETGWCRELFEYALEEARISF